LGYLSSTKYLKPLPRTLNRQRSKKGHCASLVTMGGQPSHCRVEPAPHAAPKNYAPGQSRGTRFRNTFGRHKCTIRITHKPRQICSTSRTKNKPQGLYRTDPGSPQPRAPPHNLLTTPQAIQWLKLGVKTRGPLLALDYICQRCAKQVSFTGLLT